MKGKIEKIIGMTGGPGSIKTMRLRLHPPRQGPGSIQPCIRNNFECHVLWGDSWQVKNLLCNGLKTLLTGSWHENFCPFLSEDFH